MVRSHQVILIACILAGGSPGLHAADRPALFVELRHTLVNDHPPSLVFTTALTYLSWTTAFVDKVVIYRKHGAQEVPLCGEIELDEVESAIVVASGLGGATAEAVGVSTDTIPCPHLKSCWGGIYVDVKAKFDAGAFFRESYRHVFVTKESINNVAERAISTLQSMGYVVAPAKDVAETRILLTVNFNFHPTLQQSLNDQLTEGELRRQIAFAVRVERGEADTIVLLIRPTVKQNHPRDDDKWFDDSDGLQRGIKACKQLAEQIGKAIQGSK